MALSDPALSELAEVFRTGEGTDFIRECVRVAMQELIDAEATAAIGADRYERTESRVTERNGSRPRLLTTHAGDIALAVPPSCAPGRSSRASCRRGAGSTSRCTRW